MWPASLPMYSPSIDLPKPPIPYIPGWKFPIQSHVPPPKTLATPKCCYNSNLERVEREQLSPLERCLRNPPLAGQEPSQPLHTFDLRIVHPVRIGDGRNSQVFIVKPYGDHPLPQDKKLVAKVYDPLYLDDDDGIINPFKAVNQFYTHEVRAYEMLSDMQGQLVPRYYGSYTTNIAADNFRMRAVRLILIEYVEGISMLQVHPNGFSQGIRQQIMRSVIDFDTDVYHQKNILLRDLCPRNVMLLETTTLEPSRHLVFVDFAGALFNRKRDDPRARPSPFLNQYISPLLRCKNMGFLEFSQWIDWDWKTWLKEEYAHTAGTITQEMRDYYSGDDW